MIIRQIDSAKILISLQGNGLGIAEKKYPRIFNPFFTTKPVGKGTGLGLSISYQIVTQLHQGELLCDSSPDRGSEFNNSC
jgi:signal transduction histidine kinase